MIGKTNSSSGGAADLGFSVVASDSPPAEAENRIWVKDVNMTDWCFSATQPENPSSGLVWFQTGKSSSISFSALKDKIIMVYPIQAFYYNGSAWETTEVEIYQNGNWEKWIYYVYELHGENPFTAIGYLFMNSPYADVAVAPSIDYNSADSSGIKISIANEYVLAISGWKPHQGIAVTSSLNVEGFTKIKFNYHDSNYQESATRATINGYISTSSNTFKQGTGTATESYIIIPAGSGVATLNIPNDFESSGYIGIAVRANANEDAITSLYITGITLE